MIELGLKKRNTILIAAFVTGSTFVGYTNIW